MCVAMLLALGVMAWVEVSLRAAGHEATVEDSPASWALQRRLVAHASEDAVVIVGSSRVHLGIRPDVLSASLPGNPRVYQLAISASSTLPILEELASDERFASKILLEFHPQRVGMIKRAADARAERYLASWTRGSFYDPFEVWLKNALYFQWRILGGAFDFKKLPGFIASAKLPERPTKLFQPDRSVRFGGHVTRASVAKAKPAPKESLEQALARIEVYEEEALADRIERMARAVEAIRARGGEVYVFRINSSGRQRAVEASAFGRREYYERARSRVGGFWVHFEDDPVLREIPTPDDSHVIGEDAITLTRRVAELLAAHE